MSVPLKPALTVDHVGSQDYESSWTFGSPNLQRWSTGDVTGKTSPRLSGQMALFEVTEPGFHKQKIYFCKNPKGRHRRKNGFLVLCPLSSVSGGTWKARQRRVFSWESVPVRYCGSEGARGTCTWAGSWSYGAGRPQARAADGPSCSQSTRGVRDSSGCNDEAIVVLNSEISKSSTMVKNKEQPWLA